MAQAHSLVSVLWGYCRADTDSEQGDQLKGCGAGGAWGPPGRGSG